MEFISQQNLQIGVLVTDRHRQINKWIRENHPEVAHYYDVWHVAKGFRKKVESLAKQKECKVVLHARLYVYQKFQSRVIVCA